MTQASDEHFLFRHEKLEVFRRAQIYARDIYLLTETFPLDERFGLTSQLRRASGSISHNIAEGNGRKGVKDKSRFLEIAYGSLLETVSQLSLAVVLDFLQPNQTEALRSEAVEIASMLSGLRKRYQQDGG